MLSNGDDLPFENLEKDILKEINNVRANPSSYIEYLKDHLQYFKGNILELPNEHPVETYEGPSAYEEAIEFLSNKENFTPGCKIPLIDSEFLISSAKEHSKDIGENGLLSHTGSDGNNVNKRIKKYCEWVGCVSENLDFGGKEARVIMIAWIVDDGLDDRPHRRNIFSEEFRFVGVSCAHHKEEKYCTVVDFASFVHDEYDWNPYIKRTTFDIPIDLEKDKDSKTNAFQEVDPDAPDETVSVEKTEITEFYQGQLIKKTKKIYTLKDGSKKITEKQHN